MCADMSRRMHGKHSFWIDVIKDGYARHTHILIECNDICVDVCPRVRPCVCVCSVPCRYIVMHAMKIVFGYILAKCVRGPFLRFCRFTTIVLAGRQSVRRRQWFAQAKQQQQQYNTAQHNRKRWARLGPCAFIIMFKYIQPYNILVCICYNVCIIRYTYTIYKYIFSKSILIYTYICDSCSQNALPCNINPI